MKKILSAIMALVMVCSLACVAFAAEDTFVPSITYKGAPEVIKAQLVEGGKAEDVTDTCLLITAVADAEKETRLPEAAKSMLLGVYKSLNAGTMELPADMLKKAGLMPSEAVIRELVDMSWLCEEDPRHSDRLEDGAKLVVTFEMKGLEEGETICVMTYKNNEWNPIADVKNNGDGTITCTFEHLCPVAFVVGPDGVPPTGMEFDAELLFWVVALITSAAALVVVVSKRRQNA